MNEDSQQQHPREPDREAITRFLLGECSEVERERIEGLFLSDDAFFEKVVSTEEELLHSYIGGEAGWGRRKEIERRLLASPRSRENIQLEAALLQKYSPAFSKKPGRAGVSPAQVYVAAAVALLFVTACVAFLLNRQQLAPSKPGPVAHTVERKAETPQFLTFLLVPAERKGRAGTARLVIPPGTDFITLQARLSTTHADKELRATIRNLEEIPIWGPVPARVTSEPSGAMAAVDVPAAKLNLRAFIVAFESRIKGQPWKPSQDYGVLVSPQ